MELVQSRIVTVMRELNLELQLVAAHGSPADRAGGADAWASPGAIWTSGRELAGSDSFSGLLAEKGFVCHLDASTHGAPMHKWMRDVFQGG